MRAVLQMQTMTIEKTIFSNLIYNENYARRVLPFIKSEYFQDKTDRILFEEIYNFMDKYQAMATKETLSIELDNRKDLNGTEFQKVVEVIESLKDAEVDMQWLVTTTEKFCKDKAVYNAILSGIQIIEGKDREHTQEAIPSILSEALAVGFDQHIGHDYIENADERFEFYHKKEEKLEFDLDYFNRITKGGLPNKTLNVALAGTGVGKSLFMCHMAAATLQQNKNVLYITMEMAEEKIAERIDANLMDIPIQQLETLPKNVFEGKIAKIAKSGVGKLIVKEYPTGAANSAHFRALLNELKLKKNFEPDMIFIDYLNICSSSRMKAMGGSINSYTYIKAIAEELRGLAVEFNVPIMSATQTTRGGYDNSDVSLTDTSESFGLPATADLMFALISTEEMEELGQVMVKQLKNRYNDVGHLKRFVLGIDRSRMKLYDVEESAQQNIMNDSSPDTGPIATWGDNERKDFSDFKI